MVTPIFVFVQQGDILNYTNNTASQISPGDPIPMAACFGVAVGNVIAPGATGAVVVHGVIQGPADPTTAFNQGDKLYWDHTNKFITNNATGTDIAGYAWSPKGIGYILAEVKLPY